MTENNHRKQFNLKLVLKEIIQPKVPTIALVIFLNFIFFLFGVFTFYSAIFFIIIFIGFFLALSNEKKISLDTTQNNINKKDKDELVTYNINQIKMIFDGFPESVILIDDKDNIINSNDKANKNFFSQLENENILGMRIQNVIRSTLLFDALELLKNNEEVTIKEIEIILPSEIERTYDVFISKVKLFSQDINNYLLILRETTDLKKIMTLRSEFIANASHELKTPIAVIKGISETLEKYGQDDKDSSKEFLKKLLSESNRAQSLIEDLLSLNQAEMRQHILPDKRINLISIIDNIYDGLNELAKKNKINLTRDIRKKNYYILGDEDDIRRTFINLIENAIKYNSSGKEVIIHLSDNSDKVLFKVIDDGPGISSIHIPRLTERFYRVDLDSSIKKGGTGLGLSIVKNIITRHKAQLDIDSELGKGSSFSIIFNKA
jgi:two-component system phosphate regulon sensor histidine kinase PhoR